MHTHIYRICSQLNLEYTHMNMFNLTMPSVHKPSLWLKGAYSKETFCNCYISTINNAHNPLNSGIAIILFLLIIFTWHYLLVYTGLFA